MKTSTHPAMIAAFIATTMTMTAAVGLAAAIQPQTGSKQNATTRTPAAAGSELRVKPNPFETRNSVPFPEPANCQSAIDRLAQADRIALRERLAWNSLDPELKEALWDEAVGPDQLNDGYGFAQVRPSLRENGDGGDGFGDRGDFGDRGVNLVLLSWDYTNSASAASAETFAFDMDLNVEGDVSFVGTLVSPDGTLRMKATEMRGVADATEGYTKNWDQNYNLGAGVNNRLEAKSCVSDLRGNLFTGGLRGNGQYHLAQLSGSTGARLNDRDFTVASGATGATVFSTTLDPEGILYVAGAYSQDANLRCFVARHNPDATLTRTWINTDTLIASTPLRVVTDRRGAVYFMFTTSANVVKVTKLSPYDGIADWTWTGEAGWSGSALELDAAGNPHVAIYTGTTTNDWKTVKLDTATGTPLWTRTVTNGKPVDLKIDTKGNVFVLGTKGTATARVVQYTASGDLPSAFLQPSFGTTGEPYKLALDWIGNPYVAITFGTSRMSTDVRKFDPATGAEVWQYQRSPVFDSTEVNGAVEIIDLLVDASGSVFVCGQRAALAASGGAYLSKEFFFIKYEQPYVSIPQIARSYPVVRIEGNSIWSPANPDLGGTLPGWADTDKSIFNVNVTSVMNTLNDLPGGGLDGLTQREVNYGAGTAGGGLDINVANGQFNVFFRSSVNGGSYDATVSGELAIAIPGEEEINVGQPVTITINFDPDAAGMELITNGRPELNAGIYARIKADVSARLFGRDSVLEFFGAPNPFFDLFVGQRNFDYTQQLIGLNLFPIPPGGTWYEMNQAQYPYDQLASGRIRFPNLGTEGYYTDGAAGMTLSSRLSETFLDTHLSITNLVSILAVNTPLSFTYGTPVGNDDFEATVGMGILQAYLEGTIDLEQDLDLVMRPYVDLSYDTGASARVYLTRVVDTNGEYSYQASEDTPNLPAAGFTITPTFGVRASLQNRTGFRFGALAGFAPVQVNAALEIVGVDIIDLDLEPGKLEQDLLSPALAPVSNNLNGGRVDLLDTTSNEFDFSNDVVCAPIVVTSTAANNFPQLIGSSRAAARMIIYEQRTPTQAEFNALAAGSEPMVLYGRKFFTGVGGNTARIKHCGRTESLATTRLNDQALLVQVPKRFFLLPGVARLWVTNNNGKSETIEFTIEHPMPNFQGLTEPIWAGDPKWLDEGVVAIDGGTPFGNDSFIARRDYYTLLRTTLWNPAFLQDLGNPGISATSYFPDFKPWETGGTACPPGFPSLLVNGVALERKRPFVNDGYFRSKMQQGVYASPGFLTMELVNPGPGGGPSRSVIVEVPAPRPVIDELTPAEIDPGSIAAGSELRIVVNGPESVPFFPGYENEKYGNFTPGSVVLLDGTPLRTEFVSSGHLAAYIPAAFLNTFGARMITVSTPANGTDYTEELIDGGGVSQNAQQIASGGVSLPMTLNVRWGVPVVTGVSNRTMSQGEPPLFPVAVNGLAPPDSHNFTIIGKNFAPGASVYWNGSLVPATRNSAGLIRATVSANEVRRLGLSRLQVANPPSSGSARLSNDYRITIEAP